MTTEEQVIEYQLLEVLPAIRKLEQRSPDAIRDKVADGFLTSVSTLNRLEATITAQLPIFEAACSRLSSEPLIDAASQEECLSQWDFGVTMIQLMTFWKSARNLYSSGGRRMADLMTGFDTSLASVETRYLAATASLATTWLKPVMGESRSDVRGRVPSLRPVEDNERLQVLMSKNTEGTLTPVERGEFERLCVFFETLQDIVDAALYPSLAAS